MYWLVLFSYFKAWFVNLLRPRWYRFQKLVLSIQVRLSERCGQQDISPTSRSVYLHVRVGFWYDIICVLFRASSIYFNRVNFTCWMVLGCWLQIIFLIHNKQNFRIMIKVINFLFTVSCFLFSWLCICLDIAFVQLFPIVSSPSSHLGRL